MTMEPNVHSITETPPQLTLRSLLGYSDGSEDRNGESPKRKAKKDDRGPKGIVSVPGPGPALQLDSTPQSLAESEEDNRPEQDPPPSRDSQSEQDIVGEDNPQHTKPYHINMPWVSSRFDKDDYQDQKSSFSDCSNDADDESGPFERGISSGASEKPKQGWNEANWAKQTKRTRKNGSGAKCPAKRKLNLTKANPKQQE